jgi:hypothetical protein
VTDFFGIPEDEVRPFGVDVPWGPMDRAIAGTRDARQEGGRKMKTTIVTLFAAAMIIAAPAALAQNGSSKAPDQHRLASKKQVVSGYATKHAMHARSKQTGHPGTFGHAPNVPTDQTLEISRQAGGGGSM